MEALVCRNLGDPTIPPDSSSDSPLTISKYHPIPALSSPTSVRVRVRANTLNFATMLKVEGKYQEKAALPFVLGSDYSDVDSFAQFIVVDQTKLYCLFWEQQEELGLQLCKLERSACPKGRCPKGRCNSVVPGARR
ncbi:hypothetical protein AgCh_006404 [Apium graveolens]